MCARNKNAMVFQTASLTTDHMADRPKRKFGKLGFLTTAHGFSEDALGYPFDFENKRVAKSIRDAQLKYQQERRQERSKKIVAAFPDEILRRMARRAGISSLSPKDGVALRNEVRKLADVAIFNIAKQCMFIADHQRKTTISEHILKTALATLDHHELACPGESELPKCKSLRQTSKRKSGSPRRSRGTVVDKEIEHERGSSFCVYLERAPLARYFKLMFEEQNEELPAYHGQHVSVTLLGAPVKLSREAFNCLWVVLEHALITLLEKAANMVEKTTTGSRKTVSAQDLNTVIEVMHPKFPLFHGRPRELLVGKDSPRHSKQKPPATPKASPRPKSKPASPRPKPKPTAKPHAKPKAKAQPLKTNDDEEDDVW